MGTFIFGIGGRPDRARLACLLLASGVVAASAGCARVLTIEQSDYINTAMHWDRAMEDRTGQPLEVAIVCVTPGDLDHEANGRLDPDGDISADVWFQDMPQREDKKDMDDRGGRFYLPKDHVFWLTDSREQYGKRLRGRLNGAKQDKQKDAVVEFKFPGPWHNKRSVIYVFPKFVDKNGQILPVKPAKFDPPGAFTEKLYVRIGVDSQNRANYGQYVEVDEERCPRKLHGKGDDD
ncbi:MAG: hypothetical protein GY778_14750 [bacterium]|nr:hypothetical protein [bacterium]